MQNELNEAKKLIHEYVNGNREVKAAHIREAIAKIPKPFLEGILFVMNTELAKGKPYVHFFEDYCHWRHAQMKQIRERRAGNE